MPARRSTLRNVRNVEINSFAPSSRASSKIAPASRTMSSRYIRSTPCFLYDNDSRIKSSRRATEILLRAGILILFRAESRALAFDGLLHSTSKARPRTMRIIETAYSSVLESLSSLILSSDRVKRYKFELSFLKKKKKKKKFSMKLSKISQKKGPKESSPAAKSNPKSVFCGQKRRGGRKRMCGKPHV